MAAVICKTCGQEVKFDETKLPQQVVSFSCPSCKTKVTYDNRQKGRRLTVSNITLKHMEHDDLADVGRSSGKQRKSASGPGACVLFKNGDIAPLITAGLEEIGYEVDESFSDEKAASDYIRKESPSVVLVVIPKLDGPPSKLVKDLMIVSSEARRKIFLAVIAENVKSNDGNAAFLYGVDCLISRKDLDRFHHILYDAIKDHQHLYHHYFKLKDERRT